MLLYISISISIALLGIVIIHNFINCMQIIPWSLLLTLVAVFFIISMIIHAANWKCWHFLWWKPRRLQSFTAPPYKRRLDTIPQIVLYLWTIFAWISYFELKCFKEWWWIAIFNISLLIYTAISSAADWFAMDSSNELSDKTSLSEPSESDADNVNADVGDFDLESVDGGVVELTSGISSSSSSSKL